MMLQMQSRTQRHSSPENGSDEMAPDLIPVAGRDPLWLRLVAPNGVRYQPIGPGHRLHRSALLAWHWQRKHPARAQELAATLADAWPMEAGERPKRESSALVALDLAREGLTTFEVAERLSVQIDTARRLINLGREVRRGYAAGEDFAAFVEAVGTATQPAGMTWAQSVVRAPQQAAAWRS